MRWEANYLALQGFLHENGGEYPSRYAAQQSTERSIGYWAAMQRQAYAGKGDHVMTDGRAARLKLLPGWWWKASGEGGR